MSTAIRVERKDDYGVSITRPRTADTRAGMRGVSRPADEVRWPQAGLRNM